MTGVYRQIVEKSTGRICGATTGPEYDPKSPYKLGEVVDSSLWLGEHKIDYYFNPPMLP